MNTEQLKQAAMAATPGPWLYETSKRPGSAGNYQLILSEDENSVAECYGTDHEDAANGRYIAAANPAVILALLECVDALEAMLLQVPETNWTKPAFIRARAALQKLGAL